MIIETHYASVCFVTFHKVGQAVDELGNRLFSLQCFGNLFGTFGKTAIKEIVGYKILYSLTNILMKIPQIICNFLTGIGFCVINYNLSAYLPSTSSCSIRSAACSQVTEAFA